MARSDLSHQSLYAMLSTKALEASILGTVLSEGVAALRVLHDVSVEDFDLPAHREIYKACLRLDQDDSAITYPTVGAMLAGQTQAMFELAGLTGGVLGQLPYFLRELRAVKSLQRAVAASKRIAALDNGTGGLLAERISQAQRLARQSLLLGRIRSRSHQACRLQQTPVHRQGLAVCGGLLGGDAV